MSHRGQGTQQSLIPNTSIGLCFLKDSSLYLEIGRTSEVIEGFPEWSRLSNERVGNKMVQKVKLRI